MKRRKELLRPVSDTDQACSSSISTSCSTNHSPQIHSCGILNSLLDFYCIKCNISHICTMSESSVIHQIITLSRYRYDGVRVLSDFKSWLVPGLNLTVEFD